MAIFSKMAADETEIIGPRSNRHLKILSGGMEFGFTVTLRHQFVVLVSAVSTAHPSFQRGTPDRTFGLIANLASFHSNEYISVKFATPTSFSRSLGWMIIVGLLSAGASTNTTIDVPFQAAFSASRRRFSGLSKEGNPSGTNATYLSTLWKISGKPTLCTPFRPFSLSPKGCSLSTHHTFRREKVYKLGRFAHSAMSGASGVDQSKCGILETTATAQIICQRNVSTLAAWGTPDGSPADRPKGGDGPLACLTSPTVGNIPFQPTLGASQTPPMSYRRITRPSVTTNGTLHWHGKKRKMNWFITFAGPFKDPACKTSDYIDLARLCKY